MLDDLDIQVYNAEAIIAAAKEFEVYDGDMPETDKSKVEDAHEVIALAIDAYEDEDIRPDNDDEKLAKIGEQIVALFTLAGVSADDGEVEFEDAPELDELKKIVKRVEKKFKVTLDVDLSEQDEDEDDDDEAAVDVNDVIEGYDELTVKSRINAIKELDDEDDDEYYNNLTTIKEWEDSQDKPSSRVLDFLQEKFAEFEDDDDDSDEDEEPEEDEETEDDEVEVYAERDLKKLDKDDLRKVYDEVVGEDEFPKRFTDNGKARVIAAILAAQSDEDDDEDEADEPEEAPAPKKRGRPAKVVGSGKGVNVSEPDEDDDDDENLPAALGLNGKGFDLNIDGEKVKVTGLSSVLTFVTDHLANGASKVTVTRR